MGHPLRGAEKANSGRISNRYGLVYAGLKQTKNTENKPFSVFLFPLSVFREKGIILLFCLMQAG